MEQILWTVNNTCSIWAQHNLILELVTGHLEETEWFVFVNFSSKWGFSLTFVWQTCRIGKGETVLHGTNYATPCRRFVWLEVSTLILDVPSTAWSPRARVVSELSLWMYSCFQVKLLQYYYWVACIILTSSTKKIKQIIKSGHLTRKKKR